MSKNFTLGLFLILIGIVIGLYLGIYWAFVGGLVQVFEQIRAPIMNSRILATGIVKVLFSGLIVRCLALIFIIPGYYISRGK